MRRKGAISGLLFMGVLIVLGTMGLVYGSWSENLSINGSVKTGEVDVRFEAKSTFETGEKDGPDGEPKNYASCEILEDVTGDATKISVNLDNAFPGYSCHFWTNIYNVGTLPVSVTAVLDASSLPAGIRVIPSPDSDSKGDCQNLQLMPSTPGSKDSKEWCDWTVFVDKSAPQGEKNSFSIDIVAELINKPAS